ncbi:hypothetical protein ACM46_10170 [Chryseobacterium angstadtii]|uniref:Carrier domain-containing protein n=1 Tax=Chryseobacterium angstadtii TaxID=558151 RepID=A0A0J7IEQ6_9FLAO|nr:non-ribosomal peptide synthetase [Chryseobacterium angstadtii]KMQ64607.1 hypothetical protein ACM46_10170 [Chryseobacterium angstadtii]
MLNTSSLSNIFWLNKTKNKEAIVLSEKETEYLEIQISRDQLDRFLRISRDNSLSKLAIVSSVFSFLLDRYFDHYQNVIKIYPSELIPLNNSVLVEVQHEKEITFKDQLKSFANEIKEVVSHSDYDPSHLDLTAYSGFSIQLGQKFESVQDDISLFYNESDDTVVLAVYYKAAYPGYVMESLLNSFIHILSDYDRLLDTNVADYALLTEQETAGILNRFNTVTDYPSDKTIVDLFESQARENPDALAVAYGDIALSYADLNRESNRLAHYLKDRYTIQADDLICIQLPRSEKMIISILGILKSGGAYVPVDIDYPKERVDYILADTRAKVNIDAAFLAEFDELKNEYPVKNPESDIRPDHLAYVIYTSGTTGKPKGVMIEHQNVFHSTINRIHFYAIESMLLVPSFSFDSSVAVIFGTLCSGGRLFIESSIHVKDVEYISYQIIRHKIQGLLCVPNYYSSLLPYLSENILGKNTLQHVIVAGEELSKSLVINHQKYSDAVLYNEYGPTECAVWSSVSIVNDPDVHIGKSIANTQIYILDEYGHVVPVGVSGELYIAGSGLARGYLNREDLTAEKFVDNPFAEGTKMYRTGDLGRWLPDGNIEYLGRIDHQVKIRGHRIELGEIDSQVLSYSDTIKSAVTEVKEHNGDKNLVVYFVSDSAIDKQELAYYLETKLPQYMLPGFYVALDSIPLTSNGKIDRTKLPAVGSEDLIKTEYVAAETAAEKALVDVCEQVLKHSPISIRDNYYNLGGDSIKSIQIVSRLRQRGYTLKVEHILQYPVLEELSRYITTDVVSIDQSVVTGASVLTPIQRYFFESEEMADKNYYNQSVILKSTERLSASVLESSIQTLVAHHDALRMEYQENDGVWSQYNAGAEGNHYRFESFDIRNEGSVQNESAALQKIGETLQSTINIGSGVLFHIAHVSMSDGDRIILVIHHLVVDGVSWRILLEDLEHLYQSGIKEESYSLPSKTDAFQSWGAALEEYSNSASLSKERSYWEAVEAEAYPAIPTDYPLSGNHILDHKVSFTFNKEQTRLLQTQAGKKYNAEINDVLLAGLALSLQDHFGIRKTKVLMEGHGREVMNTGLDISRTVGWFTSVYPFSLDISADHQPALVSVKEGLRRIPHKGISYGVLNYMREAFSSVNKPSVQFNYLGDFDAAVDHSLFQYSSEDIGLSVSEANLGTDRVLDISGMVVNGEMSLTFRYSVQVFKEDNIQKLAEIYQAHLEQMIVEDEASEVILTPSDLTYSGLSFNTLAEINKGDTIEDIYELSPMQQGLYYHWLAAPKGSAYFMQTSYRVKSEKLDLSKVEEAFNILVNRYTILRTSFESRYEGLLLQFVHKKAHIDFKHLIVESDLELDHIKQEDIARGFDLAAPTQMRLTVITLPGGAYEFIWSHHHIIMDGWCLGILINDFSTILNSLEQKLEIHLPESKKYSTYIKWLEGVDKEEATAYWGDYLKGITSPTAIPFKKHTPEAESLFTSEKIKIENAEFKNINSFCQSLGITQNTYIKAVWSYLLSSYNRSEEVVFGSVVSGRPAELEGIENMVGLFINTIPVCVKVDENETPRSLLNKLHLDSIQSTGSHFSSLAEIQSLSSLGKELINHILVFENYVKNEEGNAEFLGTVDVFEQANYDFTVVAVPGQDSLDIEFRYDAPVFYPSSITSLISHFKHILHQFVSVPDLPLRQLDYISTEEKSVLSLFGNEGTHHSVDKTIVDLFEEQVHQTPDHTAVVYEESKLTYTELNEESNRLAHYLREQYNIESEDLICIQLPRSEKILIAVLGILKSGGAYVPVDTDYPEERKEYILKDTQCKVVIDEPFLLEFEALKGNYSVDNPAFTVKPENLAYIIYTSGTTGNPKGAMIEHKNVVRLLFNDDVLYNFNSHDSWTLFHSYNFDFSIWECYGALLFGGTLHVISKQRAQDPGSFLHYIIENKITVLNQTPAAFYNLAEYDKLFNKKELSLRYIIFGGEVLNPVMLKDWQSKYPSVIMMNGYGPTETTVFASKFKITNDSLSASATLPIGKPISDTYIYILDSNENLVPIGVSGELYISGSGLARGYLNRADLTAEKFVDNPFVAGAKMYRTGDLGRWLPDGNIEYLGRIDHQVKIRGHRIELGEIDSQVLSYSDTIKSAVTEVKEHDGDKNLVVYYVSDSAIDKQELAYYLETKLPQYMLPGFYVQLDAIPLTSNGKVDRRALPEVSSEDLIKTEYVSAETLEEKALVDICEQVLKHSPISLRDNYYNLGGDSIKSIQIVSRLRQRGYNLKVEHILQYPVLEELSRYITTDVISIDQSVITGSAVLTPIQRYFFESEDIVNKNHYNQSVLLKSTERLSGSVLESSIRSLVLHHDALRMEYRENDGFWSQYNAGTEEKHYHFEYFDVRNSANESEEQLRLQEIGERLQSTINIESGILFHVGHVSMSDGDRIILVIHHLVVDGVSWRILLEDLGHLYESGTKGLSYELPSKTDSFQSWGTALENYSSSSALSKELSYWKAIEAEVYPAIPTDYPVTEKHVFDKSIGFTLNKELTQLLQTRAGKQYSAEINDVLLTGLALSLQDHFGLHKTKVLMEGHGREVMNTGLDISRTVGWFTSVYPFSLDISNSSQPALVSVKEGLRNIPHKGIGYGILKYLDQGLSSACSPSVQFNYLGDFDDLAGDSLLRYSSENIGHPVSEDNQKTHIILDVSGMTVNGEMTINIRYSEKVFKEETVQKLINIYQSHLEQMIAEDKESEVILTPSDLTYSRLSFNTLQEINKDHNIEDIYELSPMQQGLYYHWLVDPQGSAYFMQTSYRVKSDNLDLSKVEKAFSKLLNRYTILRTSFDNRYGEVPLQIVHQKANVDFKHLILESDLELDNIKQGDIERGFHLSEPTQMRLLIVELPDNAYEFIWSHHHIIMDGWCLSILIHDFSAILNSLQQGLSLNLPEPQKYASYIKWLEEVDQEAALEYWKNYLQGINTPTLIPFEKQDQDKASHYLAETLVIDQSGFQEIDTFCQYLGITLNTYVQAVWSYLLSSYNRSEEVVFGAVVSGRPADLEGVENMVGLFINTIPVRVSVERDETPRSLLKKLHRDSIQSIGYHFTGLSEIQPLTSLGKELINNVIVFENYAKQGGNEENSSITGLAGQNVDVFEETNYAFTIVAIPDQGSLKIDFRYDSSVFDPSSILSLVSHFKHILHQFVGASDVPLSELDYVGAGEKAALDSFSNTGTGYEVDKTIVGLFEEQVLRTPDHTAVVYEDVTLSYSALNSESNQLAHYLSEKYAIQGDDLICIRLPRSEKMLVSILGVLKSGGAYVPIDTDYPQERIDFILNDTQCKVTIDEAFLLEFEALKGSYPTTNPEFIIKPDHLAYIIYTSGTTGTPKGVMIEHKNVVRLLFNDDPVFEFSSNDSWTLFHSYNFDFSVWECYGALLFGGSLHVISRQLAQDPGAFLHYIVDNKITVLNQTPAAFYNLSKYSHQLNPLNKEELSLRYIIFGGEVLNPVMLRDWQIRYPGIKMVNMYGPTETTVFASKFKIEREHVLESAVLPIGKPVYDTPVYILDEYGHLVPVGIAGELHIAGAGLARGYLNRAELTAEKFIDNPFMKGTKMYRTGDLGKWLPDGNIEYLGRADHQVKIRGHRIELGEIDSQVLSYSEKIKAVVTEVKEHEGDKSLVVYYVSDSTVEKQELAQYLEAKLPQYMVPSFYVELDHIPLTHNGKIDREQLPEISSSDLIKKEYVAPTTDLEKQLVEIWEEILGIGNIGITDNFFELGGNSMNVIRIIGEIQNKMGKLINVGAFLEAPTITELVLVINTLGGEEKKVFKTII